MLTPGFHPVPKGHVATVVTHLEMSAPPSPGPNPSLPEGMSLRHAIAPENDWYLDLYDRIGTPWLWFSRRVMADQDLSDIITDPKVKIFALEAKGRAEGLIELDFRQPNACELAFFGVTPQLVGRGAGQAMMAFAIEQAFSQKIARFHVHTCTLDSPQALGFYRRSGFTVTGQEIEIAPDPRLTGDLPQDSAPQIPIIRGSGQQTN